MNDRMGKRKVRVIRANPVARVLGGSQYRLRVKPSVKVYKRSDNKKIVQGESQDRKDPMASLPLGEWGHRILPALRISGGMVG